MPIYTPDKIPKKWRKILLCVPVYDAIATAEDCTFDSDEADRWIEFFEVMIQHVKGDKAGQPLKLETFQKAALANCYGWKRPDGTRRYREAFFFLPRKNGKSMMLSGVVLGTLVLDGERGAELYSAAGDRAQAALIFDMSKAMVNQEPEFSSRFQIYETTKAIVYPKMNSSYKAISAEAASKHGYSPHLIVVDELHTQPNAELVDVLNTGKGARTQPLTWYITTSDYERPGSVCNEKHDYASKVRDGLIIDKEFLPIIYEATVEDKWTSEEVWAKANPNLGVSISLDFLRSECRKAQEIPRYENTFKRLYLNIRTEQAVRWLPMDAWDNADLLQDLAGRKCYAGLDLSTTTDITALALAFEDDDGGFDVLMYFWCPFETAADREKKDRVPYTQWIRDGFMEATEGNVIDYDFIRQRVNEIAREYDIEEIAYDPWNATQIANQLHEQDGIPMVQFRQGFVSMNEPSKALEALVVGGSIRHGANPVLRWMASNASVKSDPAGNIKPAKDKSTGKIDGIVALIMAIGRATADAGGGLSGYENDVPIEINF